MPYIKADVSQKLDKKGKETLKAKLGEVITLIPGKTEAVTMVDIADEAALYLAGRELEKGAFVEVRLLGKAEHKDKEALTKALFEAFRELLGVEASGMYVNIMEFENWGSGGRYK